jgi:Xaa-Pro aminopeptidase
MAFLPFFEPFAPGKPPARWNDGLPRADDGSHFNPAASARGKIPPAMLALRVQEVQRALADAGLDGWLFLCFQQNDPVALELLGLGERKLITRRCYYLIPRAGEPVKLVHRLEPAMLDHLPGAKAAYLTWQEHRAALAELVAGRRRLAAQVSPECALPTVSRLDAGTADLVRSFGIELVTSAELVQRFAATWSAEQLAGHRRACALLHEIVHAAFGRVGEALAAGRPTDEYAVQR